MIAWRVFVGKRLMGRLLARTKEDALSRAKDFWGREKKYRVEEVER